MIFTHAFVHLNVQTERKLVMEQRIGTSSNAEENQYLSKPRRRYAKGTEAKYEGNQTQT